MGKDKNPRRVADNEAMAKLRMLRTSPQKLNLVAQLIRGKKAEEALNILSFSKKAMAKDASKVLASAIANAENNHDLDVDALVTILQEPKNALVKQYKKLFELEDVELTFTDEALKAIAERAIKRKTGARGLRSIVEGILLDTMFDLPDMEGVTEIVIDEDVVAGKKDPVRVHGGDAKEEAA